MTAPSLPRPAAGAPGSPPAPPELRGRPPLRARTRARRTLLAGRFGWPLVVLAAAGGVTWALLLPVRPYVPSGARASTRTLQIGNRTRSELVIQPAPPSAGRLPLVVVLHGSDTGPAFEERRTGLAGLAGAGRAVLVYPAGIGQSWNAGGGCCGAAATEDIDDVAFVEAVVADAVAHLHADPARVYIVGYSNGGKMALRMLAADPSAWAGVAVYAATPVVPIETGPPVPVLVAGGTADPRTPWSGPASVVGGADLLERRDGVQGAGQVETVAGGAVEVTTWRGPSARQVVQLVAYEGRGHDWPQAKDSPLPLNELIERFFDL